MAKSTVKVNLDGFIKAFEGIELDVKRKVSDGFARKIIGKMKDLISKGVSPIHGHGRFPAYKAQAQIDSSKKEAKLGFSKKSQQNKAAKAINKNLGKKYPDTVKKQYPGKKRRPVNLYLSGDFLSKLTHIPILGEKPGAEIGFFDKLSKDKERGHRDMAGGQGFRPIIPKGKEILSKAVLMEAVDFLKQVTRDYYKKAFK